MLIRSLVSSKLQSLSLRCFSSAATPQVLKPGDVLRKARAFTEEDVLHYSKVTHDLNPLHTDSAAAQNVGFEGPLVHGMLVASLFPHIISSHFPGAVYVSRSLNFKFPVYIGDQVIGEVQATNLRANKNRYLVKFKTRCIKSDELVAIEGEAVAMLPTLTVEQLLHKEQ
uniref:MaoC-like domain-containing protein n=1 Tax=Lotus japonicus TaxID=34305 RepID=I3TA16_LOTJA|nr:unknown [Lotus japonicus]